MEKTEEISKLYSEDMSREVEGINGRLGGVVGNEMLQQWFISDFEEEE